MKKIFLLALFLHNFFCFSQTALEVLWKSVITSNSEISSVRTNLKNASIDYQTLQGLYLPSLSLNSITNFGENYSKGDYPNYINNSILIGQRLPGGSQLELSISYNLGYAEYNEQTYINQSPKVGITYSQSLFPFYLQGKILSPDIQLLRINRDYQEKYYKYVCKENIKSVTREYINAILYKNKNSIYESLIKQKKQKKEILKKLVEQGSQNYNSLIEIENAILMDIQNKSEIFSSYVQCVNNLYLLTGMNLEDLLEISLSELPNFEVFFQNDYKNLFDTDEYENILILNIKKCEAQKYQISQDSAPYMSLSLTDIINLNDNKVCDWKDSWREWHDDKKNTWVFGIGIDFSSCFKNSFAKSHKKNDNELQNAKNIYQNYTEKKNKLLKIYKKSLEIVEDEIFSYEKLIENNESVLFGKKDLKEKGEISEFEYITALEEYEILKLTYENYKLIKWLYKFLLLIDYKGEETV